MSSGIYFWIIGMLLLVSFAVGFLFPVFFVDAIQEFITELSQQITGMSFRQLFIFISQNNIKSAFFGLAFGIFLGIFPIAFTVVNGYVIGFVSGKIAESFGAINLLRLLPHGIFEIPAIIISLGLGLKLGALLFQKDLKKNLRYNVENSLKVFVFIVLPFLILAALIEAGLMILWG